MRLYLGMLAIFLATPLYGAAAEPSSLVDAVQAGDKAVALKMIDQKVDVNVPSPDGSTAIAWAVQRNDVELVDRLLRAGANVNVKNEFGASPLSLAVNVGNAAVIEKLLKAGADPNTPYADGQSVLMFVVRGTNIAAARLLLDHGANANAMEPQRKQTALMWAAAQKQPEMVAELVKRGADVNARTVVNNTATANYSTYGPMEWPANVSSEPRAGPRAPGGLTPLLFAAREGCTDCVKSLVAGGAKLDMPEPEGITPLVMAILNLHFDAAAVLINAGANPDKWDLWGRTPLYAAADVNTLPHGGRPDIPSLDDTTGVQIIEMLLKAGANPNIQLKLFPPYRNTGADRGVDGMLHIGTTPLLRAAKALDAPAIALLVKYGALVDLPNSRGFTPIMAAAGLGSVDADTRGSYISEDTAQRSKDSLEILVKAGADINAADPSGKTALHAAAFWGWNLAVQFLIDSGAKLDVKSNNGMTPVDSAMGRNGGNSRGGARVDVHEDTAALLEKYGVKAGTPAARGAGGGPGPAGAPGAGAGLGGAGGAGGARGAGGGAGQGGQRGQGGRGGQ